MSIKKNVKTENENNMNEKEQTKKPIVFFDLESTGLEVTKDRIVEIAMVKIHPNGERERFYSLVNPEMVIPKEVVEVHGINNAKVENEPTFKDISKDVLKFIDECYLGGYNIYNYDLPLLAEEFSRAGQHFNPMKVKVIDVYCILQKKESRKLGEIYKRYTSKVLEDAHSAEADILATIEIFDKQKELFNLPDSYEQIHEETIENKDNVDFAGKFKRNEEGVIIITFGKHKNKTVQQIAKEDPKYFKWMSEADFQVSTRNIAKMIFEKIS